MKRTPSTNQANAPQIERCPRFLPLPVAHDALVTSRPFRRQFLRELRLLVLTLPDDILPDIHVLCDQDRACCCVEPLDVTCRNLDEAIEDWTGRQYLAVVPVDAVPG